MDLPGLEKSDIYIEVKERVLAISGSRKQSTEKKKDEKILMQERSISSFSREVVLPKSVDTDAVSAEYKNGVLTITLPKIEKDREARKIKIN
jgi:HSP20 family protein